MTEPATPSRKERGMEKFDESLSILAKTQALREYADEVKKATLKEVGEWLNRSCATHHRHDRMYCPRCVHALRQSLLRGEIPE